MAFCVVVRDNFRVLEVFLVKLDEPIFVFHRSDVDDVEVIMDAFFLVVLELVDVDDSFTFGVFAFNEQLLIEVSQIFGEKGQEPSALGANQLQVV